VLRLLRFIALRRLRHERLRTLITLLGIALGVAVVLAIELANRATTRSVEVMVEEIAGRARLSVRGDEAGFADSILARVVDHAGLEAALPVLETSVRHEEAQTSLLFLGVDLLADAGPRGYEARIESPLEFVARPDRVLVTAAYAAEQGLAIGSTMTLRTARGPRRVQVGGLIAEGNLAGAYGGRVIVADIRAAQYLLARPERLDRIDLVPAPLFAGSSTAEPAGLEALAAAIEGALPPGLRVEPPATRAAQAVELLASFQVNLRMVSLVALFVGLFLVYNTMSIAVVQRRREIGILRALGVTRRRVVALFTLEGFVYGALGSALGVLLGILLARGALLAITNTLGRAYLLTEATQVPLSWPAILGASALGIGVATVAAHLPGREAAARAPAITLRSLPFEELPHTRLRGFVVLGVLLLLGAWGLSRLGPLNGVAVFGYAAGFGIVFGFAAFSPAAVLGFGRLVRPFLGRRFGIAGTLAADNLQRSVARSALAVSALLTGLSLVVCVATMIHSFKGSIVTWIENTVRADLLVSAGGGESAPANVPLPAAFADSLAVLPGVVTVNTFRYVNGRLGDDIVALCSLSLADWLRENPLVARERLPGPPTERWAVLSENFADRYALAAGDSLTLVSPSGPVRLLVGAVVLDYTSDQGAVFLDRAVYRAAWGDDLVDSFDLYLAPGASADAIRRLLDERFGASQRLFVTGNKGMRERILRSVDNTFAVVYALEAIALAIAVLGIVNTLVASLLDRRRELGLLRAIGATRRQIGRLFILEAAGLGVVGIGLGLGAGWLLSLLLVHVIQFQSTGWRFLYDFPWLTVAGTSLVTFVAATFAGWYPARIGAKTWGVEALQYE
jgi:putative ABC transport system permease protein